MTEELVLSIQGVANTKPVAASTAVHMATWPSADRGMLKRSICNRSPNSLAVGSIGSRGSRLYLCGGLLLAHVLQDLQKLLVSSDMPSQNQFSCRRLRVYEAEE